MTTTIKVQAGSITAGRDVVMKDAPPRKRHCFVVDDSAHWYCIPLDEKNQFNRMVEEMGKEPPFSDLIFEQFDEKFQKYRLNMHISNYSFVDAQEIP
jgi:hypothetical protein